MRQNSSVIYHADADSSSAVWHDAARRRWMARRHLLAAQGWLDLLTCCIATAAVLVHLAASFLTCAEPPQCSPALSAHCCLLRFAHTISARGNILLSHLPFSLEYPLLPYAPSTPGRLYLCDTYYRHHSRDSSAAAFLYRMFLRRCSAGLLGVFACCSCVSWGEWRASPHCYLSFCQASCAQAAISAFGRRRRCIFAGQPRRTLCHHTTTAHASFLRCTLCRFLASPPPRCWLSPLPRAYRTLRAAVFPRQAGRTHRAAACRNQRRCGLKLPPADGGARTGVPLLEHLRISLPPFCLAAYLPAPAACVLGYIACE